eukprot:INCI3566.1.p2 GENE.INCI3566.1~~INCI3566.1.p2  ORF type:complete len:538 (+),score=78.99 INCI3566.1:235-1848(+)
MATMLPQNVGTVPLSDKVHPSDFLPPAERPALTCMTLLDSDMTGPMARLVERVKNLPESAWTPQGQADNVCINRPYHDRLGIFNIPFVFCDDAVRTVYHFPWFAEWRAELDPIFERLGIDPARLVRCVMARLPAGVVIPVHHDTGRWVQIAHRLHCPVLTNPNVFFYAGHSEDALEKFQLPVGCAVELNNAAKHKVENLGENDRVHLMMDYADPPSAPLGLNPFPPVIQLRSDDAFVQTRRTLRLARLVTPPKPRTDPAFPLCLIIGAMKAGTTSLFDYLVQHPQVVPSIVKETHFLDWNWKKRFPPPVERQEDSVAFFTAGADTAAAAAASAAAVSTSKGAAAKPSSSSAARSRDRGQKKLQRTANRLQDYCTLFNCNALKKDRQAVCIEATPSYCLGDHTIVQRAKQLVPQVKIMFIVRDPIERCYSHYRMMVCKKRPVANNASRKAVEHMSFEEAVERDIAELRECGVTGASVEGDCKALAENYFSNRPSGHGGHSLVGRGFYLAQLRHWEKNSWPTGKRPEAGACPCHGKPAR